MLKVDTLTVGVMKANCYLVYERSIVLIIDPGDDAEFITQRIIQNNLEPKAILATHGHYDHNMAAFALKVNFNIPYLVNAEDTFLLKRMGVTTKHFEKIYSDPAPNPDGYLKEDKKIELGRSFFTVMEIPGHTPGSVALYNPDEAIVFVGDTIFEGGAIGRYDFSYSSKDTLFKSIGKLMQLPDEVCIYPGHGGSTTVGDAKRFFKI